MLIHDLKHSLKSHTFINIAVLLFVCQISAGLISPFISVFLSPKIHANTSQIGLFVTLGSLSAMLISFILAQLSDKSGKRKFFIGISLIAAVLGYFFHSITNSTATKYGSRFNDSRQCLADGTTIYESELLDKCFEIN